VRPRHTAGVTTAWLLLPDFALIAIGYLLCHHTALDRRSGRCRASGVLPAVPALLFVAIVRQPLALSALASLGAVGSVSRPAALHWPMRSAAGLASTRWPRLRCTGGLPVNSYIALALAERLAAAPAWRPRGADRTGGAAVQHRSRLALARAGGQGYLRELLRNPLILATAAGLATNLAGLQLPDVAATTLQRLGAAALPIV